MSSSLIVTDLFFILSLPASIICQLQSSTLMKTLSNSSGPLSAADRATTVFQARSLIDCQQRCAKNKCYVSNFYTDTKTCEVYNFKPATYTTSRKTCKSFRNSNVWPDYQDCLIEAVAYGEWDNTINCARIAINGITVYSTQYDYVPGFTTVQLNPSSCLTSNLQSYYTYGSTVDSDNMAAYINGLPVSTVLIGITSDEPASSLTTNAQNALAAIGVNVAGLAYRGKVAFVAQIGQPAMSVSVLAAGGGNNVKIGVIARGYPLEANAALIRQ